MTEHAPQKGDLRWKVTVLPAHEGLIMRNPADNKSYVLQQFSGHVWKDVPIVEE